MNRQKCTLASIIFLLFTVIFISVGKTPVFAEDPASISAIPAPATGLALLVSPPILDLTTEPGSSVSAKIKVKNNNDNPEKLRIEIKKFVPDNSGGRPLLSDLDSKDIFPEWLHFSETNFTIDAKGWKTINLTFLPPDNAAPAYYFAITFSRDQKVTPQTDNAALQGAAAVLCLVRVNSSRVYHQVDLQQLTSAGLDFKTKKFYEFLPVNFTVGIVNSGNVHEKAYGNIFIDWVSGRQTEVGRINVNEEGSFILPQTSRQYTSSWTDGFPVWEVIKDENGNPMTDKKGQPRRKLRWDFSKLTSFRIGKYNAQLIMIYNDGVRDIPLEAQTSFWVIPWRILLAALAVIILIAIGLKNTLQNLWHKVKRPNLPSS